MYYVYIIKSLKNQKVYTGYTSKDPRQRLREHNSGSNNFTKENGPWELIYYEKFTCKECAKNREKHLKSGAGRKIRNIIVESL